MVVVGAGLGVLSDPSVWGLILFRMLLSFPWAIRAGRAQMLSITERKEALLPCGSVRRHGGRSTSARSRSGSSDPTITRGPALRDTTRCTL